MAGWDDILEVERRLGTEEGDLAHDDAESICLAAVEDGVYLGIGRSLHRNHPELEGPAVDALVAKDNLLADRTLERIETVETLETTLRRTAEAFARSWVQERIREAARLVLDGRKEDGYSMLLDLTFDIVDRACRVGVKRAMGHQPTDPLIANLAVEKFLTEKFGDSAFIKHVAKAELPAGLFSRAAQNLASDVAHAAPHVVPVYEDEDGYQDFGGDPEAVNPEEAYVTFEIDDRVRDTQEALEELSYDEILLLEVVFVERCPVPASHVEELARRRGVKERVVLAELDERRHAQEEKRSALRQQLERRQVDLHRLQELENTAARVVEDLDGRPVETQIGHPEIDTRNPSALEKQLRGLSPEERSACLRRVSERREAAAKTYLQTHTRADHELPARPGYEEVARILGELPDDAAEEERRRVVNTITVRFRRAREKMDVLAGDRWRTA